MARSRRQRRPRSERPPQSVPALPLHVASPTGLTLSELRRELDLTQVQLAERMDVSQRAISHLEHEPNPRVGTLSSYVHGLGGRLELRVVFADRTIGVDLHESQ